eukprot:g5625.t1
MGERPPRSGDENPDSPLVFSVPASLQEYMSRYLDRPGEQRSPPPPPAAAVSPEPFPVQHWFDNRRPSNDTTAAATQLAPSSTPLRATAAEYEHNPINAAAPPAARPMPSHRNPSAAAGETGAPMMHSDYIAAWRAMSGPPLMGPVESESDRGGHHHQPPPSRRFQAAAAAAAHGGGDHGTESDGGGVGRRRTQARSASRAGRPQTSTDARRSGGGLLDRGGTGGSGSGSGSGNGSGGGGWSADSGGGRVADVPFSPMGAGGRDPGGGGAGGGGALSGVQRHWHNAYSGNPANAPAWRNRGSPPEQQQRARGVVYERSRAVEENTAPRGGGAQRGRRSLSDFLREIEEMVRAQREQQNRDAEHVPLGPLASSQLHEGLRSRPLAAAASAMGAPFQQQQPMNGGGGNHPYVDGNTRYLPPGERTWPTMTSHVSRAATGNHFPANAGAVGAGTGPYNHHHNQPAVGGRQEATGAPFRRNIAAQTGGAGTPPARSYPSHYVIPTLATSAAAASGSVAGARGRPEAAGAAAGPASQEGRRPTAARAALHPPMRLSASATAFSMPPAAGANPYQPHDASTGSGESGSGSSAAEERRTRRSIVREQIESGRGLTIGRNGLAIGREGRAGGGGVFAAAMAAARARADHAVAPAPADPNNNPDGSWASTQEERLAQAGLGFAHGGRIQHGDRGPYLEVVPLTRMAELPPERGAVNPADGGTASRADRSDGDRAGAGARTADDQGQGQSQNHLAALPAFRHWESQRARLRIQWHSPNASPEPVGTDSPASDGTMVLTEHLSSNGPSPRGGPGFGRGGGDDEGATKVEEALFACLMSLGVRRLLLERGGGSATRTRNRRTPAWLEEWLDDGARPHRIGCSSAGPSGYENRYPRVGDVWELLELLLGWWAERVCAVAAGFPMWSGQATAAAAAARGAATGSGSDGVRAAWHQQRGGGGGRQGGSGMGSLAGDAAATTQAVEAVQGLRKLGEFMIPLSRVREFIGVDGGPTPRDAVLLKSLLVVHEGIAWAVDRPHYRHYREEVIPTALKLYASLPQDVLEGVDLEVGHTLPESVFVMTGTARPSWPRWGGSPPAVTTTPSIEGQGGNVRGGGGGGGGDGGVGFGVFNGSGGDSVRMGGGGRGGGMRCAGGWEGGRSGRGVRGVFLPGPWVVFRVARDEYLDFYGGQAAALDQAIAGSAVELGHLLM